MLSPKIVRRVKLWRVICMAFSAFIFNTTEFIPVALLSDIAKSFQMPVSQTGLMITIYAWIVSLLSLPFMLLTAKLERRSLLIKLFILFILSHILSCVAWNFHVLLISRIGIAISHSVFWAITASLTVRLAPKDKKAQALGLLAMGSALAMVLGLPLGRIIGQWLGWRTTFGVIGVVAFIVLIFLYKLLPHLVSKNAGSLKSVPILFKRPLLVGLFVLTAIVISAHFTAYSYVEPFMIQEVTIAPTETTLILLLFGCAGMIASFLFGRFHRFGPAKFLLIAMISLSLSLFLLLLLKQHSAFTYPLILLWGTGIAGIGLSLQIRILQLAPDATDVAMAIFSGIYNIGIGGGALLGNQVMQHLGLSYIGVVGGILALFSMLLFLFIHLRYRYLPIQITQ
ncbi:MULTISPECIES: sugar transporter [unclassified Avibacterium]|uniref:sugar transporter n=1 Tax=unclassified Avibacterium TaxID=2685287 RepID=UPI002185C709|nr:sugar transporter [Avibacterium sp. 20-129]MCW9699288.1 sugar transporter [Avibacterium sp. 20-129]URL01665.1 sugar transporter [Avibacterium sp. 20-126]